MFNARQLKWTLLMFILLCSVFLFFTFIGKDPRSATVVSLLSQGDLNDNHPIASSAENPLNKFDSFSLGIPHILHQSWKSKELPAVSPH